MIFFLQSLWFLAILLTLFIVPGWFFLRAFFDTGRFTFIEWSLLSVAASLASLDFLMLSLFSILHLHLTTLSVGSALIIEIAIWYGLARFRHQSQSPFIRMNFSPREYTAIFAILILTLGLKTSALSTSISPSATDLGHHMYWASVISETGTIPTYTKQDIVTVDARYQLSAPEPIADFIIGEHLPFVALRLLTGQEFFSAFPVITLFFINLCSLLALFVVAWRLFFSQKTDTRSRMIAIFTLLLIGPVYAISSPQVKFVSGGVIGNTIGNFFIPMLWLVYFRVFSTSLASDGAKKKEASELLALGFFLTFGLIYTHHLSTLMFIIGLFFVILFFLALHPGRILTILREWIALVMRPAPLLCALAAILFFFLVIPPSYADPSAIGTAVGSPTKATRIGLSFLEFTVSTIGLFRMGFGLLGLLLLGSLIYTKRRDSQSDESDASGIAPAILSGWAFSLLLLSLRPQWAFINIPSNRVATYAIFPLTILAGFTLTVAFEFFRSKLPRTAAKTPLWIGIIALLLWSAVLFGNGFFDNVQNFSDTKKDQSVLETFAASRFIASVITPTDLVLKDHNYLVADSWIKHFFLRDYNFPLSRGYFKRYEDTTKNREQCTLWMISTPNTAKGRQCYEDLGVTYVMVNPHFDRKQFDRSPEFSLVYLSDTVAIYHRHQQ
jgi:hypothetical protein